MKHQLIVEKAKIDDIPQLHKLINSFAAAGDMLPRALSELYENLRDYVVIRDDNTIAACASLHIYWADLAEIRGVAVSKEKQNLGLGARLVKFCIDEAVSLGLATVFALSSRPGFFEKLGFSTVSVMELPRKVWAECYRCPKFPNCDEVALIYHIKPPSPGSVPQVPLNWNGK